MMPEIKFGAKRFAIHAWLTLTLEAGKKGEVMAEELPMKRVLVALAAGLTLLAATHSGHAAPPLPSLCETLNFEETSFVACTVDPAVQQIRMFLRAPDGKPYGSLEEFAADGPDVVFAMNAGMFMPDGLPQGLYIEAGQTIAPLVIRDGGNTNFYLKPNGVFAVTDHSASVVVTDDFRPTSDTTYATQSGPMLVIDGALHPKFSENGTSLYVRNGVGVRADGKVVFAISLGEVSFGRFARLFRDALECPNALYLDGFVSGLADNDGLVVGGGHDAGPIVAVLER